MIFQSKWTVHRLITSTFPFLILGGRVYYGGDENGKIGKILRYGGGGGAKEYVSDFFGFDICCNPSYLIFRMGSLLPLLPMVAEM